jgi:hypothetical protein
MTVSHEFANCAAEKLRNARTTDAENLGNFPITKPFCTEKQAMLFLARQMGEPSLNAFQSLALEHCLIGGWAKVGQLEQHWERVTVVKEPSGLPGSNAIDGEIVAYPKYPGPYPLSGDHSPIGAVGKQSQEDFLADILGFRCVAQHCRQVEIHRRAK